MFWIALAGALLTLSAIDGWLTRRRLAQQGQKGAAGPPGRSAAAP